MVGGGTGDPPAVEAVFRPATASDADAVAGLVDDAYRPYLVRTGAPPGPMLEDYGTVIADRPVCVAEVGGVLVGCWSPRCRLVSS